MPILHDPDSTPNKSIKFVPAFGLHRTALSDRRLLLALCSLDLGDFYDLRDRK
jgi:hypothetical protein